MSRFVCVAAAAVALAGPAAAQIPAPPVPWANKLFVAGIEKNPARPAPQVIEHNFGTVPHGTLCAHKFTVTNIYAVPLQVVDVRRSCGCLEAYPPQKVLQPNEQAEFVVTMDAAKFTGPNAQTMEVTVGPQLTSTAILRLSAVSRADVALSPGRVDFGSVAQGGRAAQAATVEYHGRQADWKVVGVAAPPGALDVDVQEVTRGFAVGAKYRVTVSLKADAPAGPLAEVVTLKTNDPASPFVHLNVAAVVQAPLTLSTNRVQLTGVKVGESAAFKVMVRATGPFKIEPLSEDADGVAVETFPAAAPVQIVTVRFAPTRPGQVRKELRLATDLNGGAAVTITFEGTAEGAAAGP